MGESENKEKREREGREKRRRPRLGHLPPEAPVFFFYLLLTLYLTWPVVTRMSSSTYGFPSDNLGTMWLWWWIRNAHRFPTPAATGFCPLLGFPFGTHLNLFPFEPVIELLERAFLLVANEVIVYNTIILSSFFLSGVTMYYLIRYLTGDRLAAFFAGFAFMMCPYHAYHAMMFGHLAITQWMPLFVLGLLVFIRRPCGKNALLLWLSAILVAGTSVQYGFFMGIFTAGFLIGRYGYTLISGRKDAESEGLPALHKVNKKTLALALLVILGTAAFVLPFYYGSTSRSFPAGEWPTRPTSGQVRNLDVAYEGAAQPWDYFFPEKENVLVGGVTRRLLGGKVNAFENSLYLGWVVIALALFAFVVSVRRRKDRVVGEPSAEVLPGADPGGKCVPAYRSTATRADVWGFVAAALLAFVLSLPPYYRFGSVRIPMPSRLFMYTVPLLRWYMRLGIVVITCFIALASYGVSWLLARFKDYYKEFAMIALMGLLFLETTLVPPFRYFDFEKVPEVYQKLARLPEGSSVIFYPAFEPGFFNSQVYQFYQRTFAKPMLNGAYDNSDGEALRRTVYNPFTKATPGTLAAFGIDYVVYLGRLFEEYEGTLPRQEEVKYLPPGLLLVDRFESEGLFSDAYLYRVTAPEAPLIPVYQGDITAPRIDEGRVTVRLGGSVNLIRVVNLAGDVRRARVRIPLANLAYPHHIRLLDGGKTLWEGQLEGGQQAVIEVPELVVPRRGLELVLQVRGRQFDLDPSEGMVFGATQATIKLGEVLLEDPLKP